MSTTYLHQAICKLGRFKDRTGFRHGKLTVVGLANPERESNDVVLWKCQCDCGNTIVFPSRRMAAVHCPKSCGCSTGALIAVGAKKRRDPQRASLNTQYRNHVNSSGVIGHLPFPRAIWYEMVVQPCHYCGDIDERGIPTSAMPKGYNTPTPAEREKYLIKINGIDRIDSSRGYEIDNCVPCCRHCNTMKNRYAKDDFLQRIKRVYERHHLDQVSSKPIVYSSSRHV